MLGYKSRFMVVSREAKEEVPYDGQVVVYLYVYGGTCMYYDWHVIGQLFIIKWGVLPRCPHRPPHPPAHPFKL